jgi:toxin ParE1/3/4
MGEFRIARAAAADLARILSISQERWGLAARHRYQATIAAAMRRVAVDPDGLGTRTRDDIARGIRSFHIRQVDPRDPRERVRQPVHIIYFRIVAPALIEIVRVLHERMEPGRHMQNME